MRFAFGCYCPLMRFNDPLTDAEPKSATAMVCSTGLACPVKTVEYMRNIFLRNADAIILNDNLRVAIVFDEGQPDSAVQRGIFYGIIHQI